MTYQDKLGVYRVGDLKFHSKLEAIEMHAATGIHPHWDFNEAVFSSYDWTVEPAENILELYRQRAQQLRDKYDYIILFYSGGADSTTALESFVNNGIHLDEVVSYVNQSATGDPNSWLNIEVNRVSVPTIKEKYPTLRHRILDLKDFMLDYFNQAQSKFDWIYEMNAYFSPNNVARESLPLKVKDWADLIHAGKRVGIVWGHDKPRIVHNDGKYSFRFIDFIDSGPTVTSIAGKQPYTDELFFWTPDLPKIVIKQAHLIKQYLDQPLFPNIPHVSLARSDLAQRQINNTYHWLDAPGVHALIYPNWNQKIFQLAKPQSVLFTPRDKWFFDMETQNPLRKNWEVGLEKLWLLLPDYWKNDPTSISKGIRACWSKDYLLS
jgi:hypothetical protein